MIYGIENSCCDKKEDGLHIYINNPDKYILMQYTGLKDKNGKEIYEGDLIEREDMAGHKNTVKVKFGWHGNIDRGTEFYGYNLNWSEEDFGKGKLTSTEVVGNIYENPGTLNTKVKE